MRTFLLGLALATIPALGNDGVASTVLYTQFQQAPPAAVMTSMRDELAKITAPMGMEFEWRSMDENKGNELSAKVAVIHFTGRCDAINLAGETPQLGALGRTYEADGAIIPFSDIDCERIRAFLRNGLLALPKEDREEAFGRAVGRVLAHELYHVLANTPRHSSDGVAKPQYTVQELLSKSFQFEQKEREELRKDGLEPVSGGF